MSTIMTSPTQPSSSTSNRPQTPQHSESMILPAPALSLRSMSHTGEHHVLLLIVLLCYNALLQVVRSLCVKY